MNDVTVSVLSAFGTLQINKGYPNQDIQGRVDVSRTTIKSVAEKANCMVCEKFEREVIIARTDNPGPICGDPKECSHITICPLRTKEG